MSKLEDLAKILNIFGLFLGATVSWAHCEVIPQPWKCEVLTLCSEARGHGLLWGTSSRLMGLPLESFASTVPLASSHLATSAGLSILLFTPCVFKSRMRIGCYLIRDKGLLAEDLVHLFCCFNCWGLDCTSGNIFAWRPLTVVWRGCGVQQSRWQT